MSVAGRTDPLIAVHPDILPKGQFECVFLRSSAEELPFLRAVNADEATLLGLAFVHHSNGIPLITPTTLPTNSACTERDTCAEVIRGGYGVSRYTGRAIGYTSPGGGFWGTGRNAVVSHFPGILRLCAATGLFFRQPG